MDVVKILGIIYAISFLVETQAEFLFTWIVDLVLSRVPFKTEEKRKIAKTQVMHFIVVGVATSLCFYYQFDLIYLLSKFAETNWQTLTAVHWPGIVMSGIAVGMGSVYLHGFIQRFFVKPNTVTELPEG